MKKNQIHGFALLEGIISLTILCSIFSICYHYIKQDIDNNFIKNHVEYIEILNNSILAHLRDEPDDLQFIDNKKYTNEEIDLMTKKYYGLYDGISNFKGRYKKIAFIFNDKSIAISNYGSGNENNKKNFYLLTLLQNKYHPIQDIKLMISIISRLGNTATYIEPSNYKLNGDFANLVNYIDLSNEDQQELAAENDYRIAVIKKIHTDENNLDAHKLLHRNKNGKAVDMNTMETDLYMRQHKIIFSSKNSDSADDTVSMEIDADKLRASAPSKKPFKDNNELNEKITEYSGAELSAWWYKLPYYQLEKADDLQNFANEICRYSKEGHDNDKAGRFFCINTEDKQEKISIFWCSNQGIAHKIKLAKNEAGQK